MVCSRGRGWTHWAKKRTLSPFCRPLSVLIASPRQGEMMPHQKGGIMIMVYNFIKSVVGYWCSGVQCPAGVSRGDGVTCV